MSDRAMTIAITPTEAEAKYKTVTAIGIGEPIHTRRRPI